MIGATMNIVGKTTENDYRRFIDKTLIGDGCWEWVGAKLNGGYGQFWINGNIELAHRFSWAESNKQEILEGMCVLHRCDNPSCVRASHLFLGTYLDNMQDMVQKGRSKFVLHYGEKCGQSKLTKREVINIRRLWDVSKFKLGEKKRFIENQAKKHKVSNGTIKQIVYRKSWKHID